MLSHPVEHFQLGADSDLEDNMSQHSEANTAIPLEVPPVDACTVCATLDSETEVSVCQECEVTRCIIYEGFCSCIICHAVLCEHCHGRHYPQCLNARHTEPNLALARKPSVKFQADKKNK